MTCVSMPSDSGVENPKAGPAGSYQGLAHPDADRSRAAAGAEAGPGHQLSRDCIALRECTVVPAAVCSVAGVWRVVCNRRCGGRTWCGLIHPTFFTPVSTDWMSRHDRNLVVLVAVVALCESSVAGLLGQITCGGAVEAGKLENIVRAVCIPATSPSFHGCH